MSADHEGAFHQLALEMKTYFDRVQRNHIECKDDIAASMKRFDALDAKLNRTHEYQEWVRDAITESAIRANKLEQLVSMLVDDRSELKEKCACLEVRVGAIETQHAQEKGARRYATLVWTFVGGALGALATAVPTIIVPWVTELWARR